MSQAKTLWLIIISALLLLVVSQSVFIVDEREWAIKFQLGEIVKSDYKPGIYFKVPFYNNIRKFDARIQTLDAPAARIITAEKKYVLVDAFVKWRIGDVVKFYKTMGSTIRVNQSLGPVVEERVRNEFGDRTIQGVVASERDQVMEILTDKIKTDIAQYGIQIVDVRVKRVDFEVEISDAVFERMRTERQRVAKEFRARGKAEAERIRADADRQFTVIQAEAYREAQIMRGEGDAKAAEIYASAYGKDAEFYSFYRSLNAYKSSFNNKGDVMLLEPDAEFFKYFKESKSGKK